MNRIFFVIIFLVSGCSAKVTTKSDSWTAETLRTEQANRTSQFTNLVGRGVIEFKWSDDAGTHKEQGELDFWKQGDSISLRISKLGELIAWFGGEGKNFWFFDMMSDESSLTIGGKQGMFNDIEIALTLLGLQPLPEGELKQNTDGSMSLLDSKNRTWTANFTESGHRPIQMKVTHGDRVMQAIHRKGIRVEIENLHELHWPETSGLIDFTDNQGNAEIKIVFSSLSTIVEDEPMNLVMNLECLTDALQPHTTKIGD